MFSLIVMIIVVVFVGVFAGFNINTRCDINLIYRTFTDVPVFLALIFAFVSGVVVSMPFVFVGRHRHKVKEPKPERPVKEPKKKKSKDVSYSENNASVQAVETVDVSPKNEENDDASSMMQ